MAKPSRKGVFKRILKQLKPYKFWVAATVFFALVSVAGNLLAPVFVGQIIDLFVGGESRLKRYSKNLSQSASPSR